MNEREDIGYIKLTEEEYDALTTEKDAEIARLRDALEVYANVDNWVLGENGIQNVWREPDSSTPFKYEGYDFAVKALAKKKETT